MAHICITWSQWVNHFNMDGLVQERCNSIANALELHLSCTNPSIWFINTIILLHAAWQWQVQDQTRNCISCCHWWMTENALWFFLGKLLYYMEHPSWVNIMHKIYDGMKAYLIFIASIKKCCHAVYMTWLQMQWHTQDCQQTFMLSHFFSSSHMARVGCQCTGVTAVLR